MSLTDVLHWRSVTARACPGEEKPRRPTFQRRAVGPIAHEKHRAARLPRQN